MPPPPETAVDPGPPLLLIGRRRGEPSPGRSDAGRQALPSRGLLADCSNGVPP